MPKSSPLSADRSPPPTCEHTDDGGLGTQLEDLLRQSRELQGISSLQVCLRPTGAAALHRISEPGSQSALAGEPCTACPLLVDEAAAKRTNAADDPSCSSPVHFPIYQGRRLTGFVTAHGGETQALEPVAKSVERLVRHDTLLRRAHARVGRQLWLFGASEDADRLDAFLARAAEVPLPTLVRGEVGTGREDLAFALHLLGERAHAPFVKIDGAVPVSEPRNGWIAECLGDATGGTLFFAAVDCLAPEAQSELADALRSGALAVRTPSRPRVIASASNQATSADGPCLHPTLEQELAFLAIRTSPLRERPDDIPALTRHFLELYGGSDMEIDDEVLACLLLHPWPGNIPELRQVVGRMAGLAPGRRLDLDDLRSAAPELMVEPTTEARVPISPKKPWDGPYGAGEAAAEESGREKGPGPRPSPIPHEAHPAVVRALRHLSKYAHEPITLGDLARVAQASPSHLSFLFRTTLGISPMAHLGALRIERARHLLATEPEKSITEVAWAAGFGDLRHFERQFKRAVGVTPSCFRERSQDPPHGPSDPPPGRQDPPIEAPEILPRLTSVSSDS